MPSYQSVLLIDDHGPTRAGVELWLRAAKPELEVRHARSPDLALEQIKAAQPDLIFLDLEFGNVKEAGLNFLKSLKASDEYAKIPVVIVSSLWLDREQIERRLLEAGAAGYICKDAADGPESFKAALLSMEAGGVYIQGARPNGTGVRLRTLGLSAAHSRILSRHVKGMPYKQIADECGIKSQTVQEHLDRMCELFNVRNSKALIWEIAKSGAALEDV